MPQCRIYMAGGFTPSQDIDEIKTFPFNFSDASPINAIQLEASVRVLTVSIKIEVPFDDPTSEITVGFTGNLDSYMTKDQNIASEVGEYETNPYRMTPAPEFVILSIDKKTSIQGSGVLLVEINKP